MARDYSKYVDRNRIAVECINSHGDCQGVSIGWRFAGAVCWIFDMFDGAMARVSNTAAIFGAFFDSMLDRYSESIIFLGLLIICIATTGPSRCIVALREW